MLFQTIDIDQNVWTRSGQTIDVQMDEGICLALCHEWCLRQALRDYHALEHFFTKQMPHMHRLFSFQRGFNLVSDSLTRGANYVTYFQVDENLTTNMVTRDGHRSGVRVTIARQTNTHTHVENELNAIHAGDVFLLGFWGVDGGENWGHVTAISWPPGNNAAYFDPNEGVYEEMAPAQLGTDLVEQLDDSYDLNDIRNFTIYKYVRI
jgi:hypothetical protein